MVRVGLWGAFDGDDAGAMLVPRIVRRELGTRLPSTTVRVWTAGARTARPRFDDPRQDPPAPLGAWGSSRADELAVASDVLVIAGQLSSDRPFLVEGVGAVHEPDLPTAWLGVGLAEDPDDAFADRLRGVMARRAHVSVADGRTAAILGGFTEREVLQVPGHALLTDRLFRPDEPEERVTRMRADGLLPQGDLVIVQGSEALRPDIATIEAQVGAVCAERGLTPVLVVSAPGQAAFADALAERIPEARRLPEEIGLDDLCAVVAWSAGTIGDSRDLALVALAFGRPAVLVHPNPGSDDPDAVRADSIAEAFGAPRGPGPDEVAELRAGLDRDLDRIAALVGDAASVDPRERSIRSLTARLAQREADAHERERELQTMIEQQARRLTESDVRFSAAWRKIRECDKHYNYQFTRAEAAEARVAQLEAQVARLGGNWHELPWTLRAYLRVRRLIGRALRALHLRPPLRPPEEPVSEDTPPEA